MAFRLFKNIKTPLGVVVFGVALVSGYGCASHAPEEPRPHVEPDSEAFWLALSVGHADTPATRTAGEPMAGEATRSETVPGDGDILSLCAYLTDADGKIIASGIADKADITDNSHAVMEMRDARNIVRGQKYRLHVVANLPRAEYISIQAAAMGWGDAPAGIFNHTPAFAANTPALLPSPTLPAEGMPMATSDDEAVEVTVPDNDKEYSTRETAYVVDTESSGTKVINLTRMLGMLAFKSSAADAAEGTAKNQYKILGNRYMLEVAALWPVNIRKEVYFTHHADADGLTLCPTTTTLQAKVTSSLLPASGGWHAASRFPTDGYEPLEYVGEHMVLTPAQVTYANSTSLIITALLRPTSTTPDDVKEILNRSAADTHPSLWYFDDGNYQGLPLVDKGTGNASAWHEIKYDARFGGYALHYVKAIRHRTDGTSATDGIISKGEYGIVRNTRYNIAVNGFTLLPHPWQPGDAPEKTDQTVSLTITVPASWDLHRQVIEL